MRIFFFLLFVLIFPAFALEIIPITDDNTLNYFFSIHFYLLLMLFSFFALIAVLVSSL